MARGEPRRPSRARRPATRGTAACATSPTGPGPEALTPVEAVFVGTAIVASIGMLIWFFAFAGQPVADLRPAWASFETTAPAIAQRSEPGERGLGRAGANRRGANGVPSDGSARGQRTPRAATPSSPRSHSGCRVKLAQGRHDPSAWSTVARSHGRGGWSPSTRLPAPGVGHERIGRAARGPGIATVTHRLYVDGPLAGVPGR